MDMAMRLQIAGNFDGGFLLGVPVASALIAQAGDADVRLIIVVVDDTNTPVDLSQASALKIVILKPDLTSSVKTAALVTNGMDGMLSVMLSATDLAEAGDYQAQAKFTIASAGKTTRRGQFRVEGVIA